MATNELSFTTRGTGDVVAAFKRVSDAQDQAVAGAGALNEQLHLTAREVKSLDKLQTEISRRNESAADRYLRKLTDTQRALAGHKDETRLLKAETVRLNEEYIKAAESSTRMSREERAALQELRTETAKLKDELGQVDDVTDEAFGAQVVTKIGAVTAAVLAATGPLMMYKKGLEDAKAAVDKAKQAAEASAPGAGELRQLADNQAEYERLEKLVQRLRNSGAVKDLPESFEATFALAGADFTDEESIRLFEQLGQKQVVGDVGGLAKSVQVYASSFSRRESGTAKQILAKAFAAAKRSPGSVNEVLEGIAGVGSAAAPEGITDEEVGAGIATLATSIGTPAEAKTALESFIFSTAEKPEMAGLSLRERVVALQQQNLSTAELKSYLGRKESMRAFSNLSLGLGTYDETLREVDAANFNTQVIDQKLAIKAPLADAETSSRQEAAFLEQQNLLQGQAQKLLDDLRARAREEMRQNARNFAGDNAVGNSLGAVGSGLLWTDAAAKDLGKTPLEQLKDINDPAGPLTPTQGQIDLANHLLKQNQLMQEQLEESRKQSAALDTLNSKDGGFVGGTQ